MSSQAMPRTRSALTALISGTGQIAALPRQPGDLPDDLLQGQFGRVEEKRVGGLLRLCRVEAVTAGLGWLGVAGVGAQRGGPALGTRSRVRGQEDLELGCGRDDRADVAALGHGAWVGRRDDRPLL